MGSATTPTVGISNATSTVAGAVKLVDSSVSANTTNGYGSSSTRIVRFTNFVTVGAGVTGADSATLGSIFTINVAGVYSVMASIGMNSVGFASITLNDNLLSTDIAGNFTNPIFIAPGGQGTATGYPVVLSVTQRFAVGDLLRLHVDGAITFSNNPYCRFVVTQVALT